MCWASKNKRELRIITGKIENRLCISFSDDEEIQELIKDDTFKVNTRSLLGVKNSNDWIFGLNIGNIMHINPVNFEEIKDDLNQPDDK